MKIIILALLSIFTIDVSAQNFIEINFNKEIIYNDTCIRFYNVINFDIKDKNVWSNISEDLYNRVLIIPNKRKEGDNDNDPEYYSNCNNVIFYCIDGNLDTNLLTIDNLFNNKALQRKIICKFCYNMPEGLIRNPFKLE